MGRKQRRDDETETRKYKRKKRKGKEGSENSRKIKLDGKQKIRISALKMLTIFTQRKYKNREV